MNKILISLLAILLVEGFAQAQNLQDTWEVFEVSSKVTTDIAVSSQQETQGIVFASIVADDDREEITGRASGLEKAVVVLEMNFNGHKALCSGSMVGPKTVLTAAHCLNHQGKYMDGVTVYAVGLSGSKGRKEHSPKPDTPKLPKDKDMDSIIRRLSPNGRRKPSTPSQSPFDIFKKKNKLNSVEEVVNTQLLQQKDSKGISDLEGILRGLHAGGYPSASAKSMWVPSEWIKYTRNSRGDSVNLDKEELYDYGIIVLDDTLGNQTGYLGLSVPSAAQLKQASILVVGRGGDKPARSLWRARGRVGKIYSRYFLHNADQVGGNSGGPIFNANNTNTIIALANFGDGRHHVNGGFPNGGLRITHSIVNAVKKAAK